MVALFRADWALLRFVKEVFGVLFRTRLDTTGKSDVANYSQFEAFPLNLSFLCIN